MDRLKKELITVAELEVAAHKQGFASLDEIDRAVLDPGGNIAFFAKRPTPDTPRHEEILARLDADVRAARRRSEPHGDERRRARAIAIAAIRDAATAVYGGAIRTPLVRVEMPGGRRRTFELYLKLEVLQPIGSFKIRGAYNVIRQLPPAELADGVWTVSAGNAAQGVASRRDRSARRAR